MRTLIYSAKSHRKIVHLPNCKILEHISKENLRSFKNFEEAKAHGYRLCNCCSSIVQKYRKEKRKVKDYCRDHGFIFKLQDEAIHVISKHDCWQMITSGNRNNLFLYHKNTAIRRYKEKNPSIIPGYHSQAFRSETIMGYLEYISSHDGYRDEHPCTEHTSSAQDVVCSFAALPGIAFRKKHLKGSKRQRKEQAKKQRQERRASIIRVNALLDEFSVIGY